MVVYLQMIHNQGIPRRSLACYFHVFCYLIIMYIIGCTIRSIPLQCLANFSARIQIPKISPEIPHPIAIHVCYIHLHGSYGITYLLLFCRRSGSDGTNWMPLCTNSKSGGVVLCGETGSDRDVLNAI